MTLRPASPWGFLSSFLIFVVVSTASAHSSENPTTEKVLSFANPSGYVAQEQTTKIAAVPRHELEPLDGLLALPPRGARRIAYSVARRTFYDDLMGHAEHEGNRGFYPGSSSLSRIQKDLVKIASLPGNNLAVVAKKGGQILDDASRLSRLGRLVGDPRSLYATYEILVDRAQYSVQLFGIKDDETRTLLFECRAGLGSVEYPTPKGTYYIVRIFDDKPLWIPPPDREWAWGQSPSRTVYGGHMMPLFSKQIRTKEVSILETGEVLDAIAPPVKMVDSGAYRVHGTDSPWSVGSNQSHGCIRLLNSSVAQLADTLKLYVGTTTRGETANGPYVNLARPVRLILF